LIARTPKPDYRARSPCACACGSPDAKIVTSSFKATYGWLGVDITQRLLEHATLTANGLAADDINAPTGQHRVTVSIADTHDRVGTRTFRFTIA